MVNTRRAQWRGRQAGGKQGARRWEEGAAFLQIERLSGAGARPPHRTSEHILSSPTSLTQVTMRHLLYFPHIFILSCQWCLRPLTRLPYKHGHRVEDGPRSLKKRSRCGTIRKLQECACRCGEQKLGASIMCYEPGMQTRFYYLMWTLKTLEILHYFVYHRQYTMEPTIFKHCESSLKYN